VLASRVLIGARWQLDPTWPLDLMGELGQIGISPRKAILDKAERAFQRPCALSGLRSRLPNWPASCPAILDQSQATAMASQGTSWDEATAIAHLVPVTTRLERRLKNITGGSRASRHLDDNADPGLFPVGRPTVSDASDVASFEAYSC